MIWYSLALIPVIRERSRTKIQDNVNSDIYLMSENKHDYAITVLG